MDLDIFYEFRKKFIVLGLTGKMQAGADKLIEILTQETPSYEQKKFIEDFEDTYKKISDSEARKVRRLKDFFYHADNWKKFDVIHYKNVILLFILSECYNSDLDQYSANICDWICKLGSYKEFKTPRFGSNVGIARGSNDFIRNQFKEVLDRILPIIHQYFENQGTSGFENNIKNDFFFEPEFKEFADKFFSSLDSFSLYLRHKLIHIVSFCLRRFGSLSIEKIKAGRRDSKSIYIIADIINKLIKAHRAKVGSAHIIIDRLKNSYEMMYFREKYSGFYMLVNNKNEEQRTTCIREKLELLNSISNLEENFSLLRKLDDTEYKVGDFKEGIFEGFDIENCVQKADYHLWNDQTLDNIEEYQEENIKDLPKTNKYYVYQPYLIQVLKLIALIQQPGLVTPTYIERMMQVAYNAKFNSGCISRQVGAVVTDSSFSVKGIGWNDVPIGHIPCSMRDLRDLKEEKNEEVFSNFEKGITFKNKILYDLDSGKTTNSDLKGRPCSYCFKSFYNKYEAKDNQVHTRSLHAEENAMLQISKHGGQPLLGGNLFTTASPCELCSKKAYQLGIKNIFYIDLYPGIAQSHILEGGKSASTNPTVYQFQGVIGRGFQKLYEPFMSIKDETVLRSGIAPNKSNQNKHILIKQILGEELLENETVSAKLGELLSLVP